MADIHSSAIVDPKARIADDVVIGPFTIVEGDVTIESGTWVGPHVVIRGHTSIGSDNRIFQFCSIGEVPQHQGYSGEPTRVVIGNGNTIRFDWIDDQWTPGECVESWVS